MTEDYSSLDDRMSRLHTDLDPRVREQMVNIGKTVKIKNWIGVILHVSRLALTVFKHAYSEKGHSIPSDNLYDVIMAAGPWRDEAMTKRGFNFLPEELASSVHTLRMWSNKTRHDKEMLIAGEETALTVVFALLDLMRWCYCIHSANKLTSLYAPPPENVPTREPLAPKTELPPEPPSNGPTAPEDQTPAVLETELPQKQHEPPGIVSTPPSVTQKQLGSWLTWCVVGVSVLGAVFALWKYRDHVPEQKPTDEQARQATPSPTQPAAWTKADLTIHKADIAENYFKTHEKHLLSKLADQMKKEGNAARVGKTDSVVLVVEFNPLQAARQEGKVKIAPWQSVTCSISGSTSLRHSDGTLASPITVVEGSVGTVNVPRCSAKTAAVFLLRIDAPDEWVQSLTKHKTPDEARKAIERELVFSVPGS